MSRSVGQSRDEHADTRGRVWVGSLTLPVRARAFLAVILLASGVVLHMASDPMGTVSTRSCRVVPVLVVDPNSAPPEVLESLPHVGPSLVRQLVEQRRIRPFTSTDDLRRRVRGLGPATMARLGPHLRIGARADSLADLEIQKSLSAPGQAKLAQGPMSAPRSR